MTTYTPNGSGHRALAVLSDGDCRAEQIPLLIFTHSAAPSREKKARHLIRQMIADRLVERRDAGWLAITAAGLDALADLRAGIAWGGEADGPSPSVRVFERRAA